MLRAAQNSGPIVGRTPLREILESFRTHAANDLFTVRNGASADRDQALPSSRHWVHTTKSDNEPGTHPGGASHSTHRWEQSTANSESRTNGSIKIKLLKEAMKYVPNYGWSDVTLQIAATDLGLSFAVLGALPRGPGHLIDFFHAKCNDELENRLCEKFKDYRSDTDPVTGMDRVAYGARCRLEMVLPYIDSWPEAMAIQARPSEMAYAARNYWSVAETIYKHSGNLSSDLTWYAKHAAIMAAYCSSELYMVQDCSPGYFDTWSFLKRRLDDGRTLWA